MFVSEISDPTDLGAAIDAHRELALHRVTSNCHAFNRFLVLARSFGPAMESTNESGFMSEAVIEKLGAEQGLAPWTFVGGLYGNARQVRANRAEVTKRLSPFGRLLFFGDTSQTLLEKVVRGTRKHGFRGSFFRGLKSLTDLAFGRISTEALEDLLSLYPILKGKPNESLLAAAYFKNRDRQPEHALDPARDECGLIFFAPLVPAIGREIQGLIADIKRICAGNRFETGILLIQPNPRTFFVISPLIFDKKSPEESQRAQRTYDQLYEIVVQRGYQQYRCCTPQMEKILDCNRSYQSFLKALKAAVDPNRIIAAGRYGI